jgi:hypothetical protein
MAAFTALAELAYYVAPDGSDSSAGTPESPFRTLQKARDAIRGLSVDERRQDVHVILRGGTYRIHETVVFGLEDGGGEYRVTYRNYPGEHPVFSSGLPLTGWKPVKDDPAGLPREARGKVWAMDLPPGLGCFKVMYDGEKLLPRARSAGFNSTNRQQYDSRIRVFQSPEIKSMVYFPPGKIRNWNNLEDIELLVYPSIGWTMNMLGLASVDEAAGIARTVVPATYPMRYIKGKGDQVIPWGMYLENHVEFLDQPGEWAVDTRAGKIWYWPASGEPGGRITAPLLQELVRVEGRIDAEGPVDVPVRNIHFKGLTFMHGERDTLEAGDRGVQHDWEMFDKATALLRFRGAEQCSVEECRFASSGGTGLRLDLFCRNISVTKSLFEDLGISGVLLCGYGPGTKDVNGNNVISNNRFTRTGRLYWHGQALLGFQTGGNLIAHNAFTDLPRKAIGLCGVRTKYFNREVLDLRECASTIRDKEIDWPAVEGRDWVDMYDSVERYYHTRNNVIEFNYCENVLQKGSDGAAINFTACGRGNVVRHNFVGYLRNPQTKGIRLDGHVRGMKIYNNIIVNGLGIAPKPPENETRNNIIVYTAAGNGSQETGLSIMFESTVAGRIENNVICYEDGFRLPVDRPKKPGVPVISFDRNLYFSRHHRETAKREFEAFRERGFETNGLFADPGFVDMANLDFRLREDSLLKATGFKEVTMEGIGTTAGFPAWLARDDGPKGHE